MRIRIANYLDEMRSSYWFVPGLMVLLSTVLSFVTLAIDEQIPYALSDRFGFIWGGGPEGARGLLSTVAGSMITVASLTFSITMLAFSQASSQFGPRLLRSFMRDTGNQIVLGTFVATFVYCLLVLRTIRGEEGSEFVPQLSVTLGVVFALASLGVLIYFIHHAALTIQAPNVIANVAGELFESIDRLFPEGVGRAAPQEWEEKDEAHIPARFEEEMVRVPSRHDGYLQALDDRRLMSIAYHEDLILKIKNRPGHFVVAGQTLVEAWPQERVSDELAGQIQEAFVMGRQRTPTQDVEYAVDQLVEVAVRALSPGINDPFTAITCIDWLGAALARLTEKEFPAPYRYDDDERLRIIVERPITFAGVVDAAFNQIRQYADSSVAVRIRLLETIAAVGDRTTNDEHDEALARQADMIRRTDRDEVPEREDREDLTERYVEAEEVTRD